MTFADNESQASATKLHNLNVTIGIMKFVIRINDTR
jgi:hypothetical protein